MHTINIKPSRIQYWVITAVHIILASVIYNYMQAPYFLLACIGILCSGYLHWLHWPRETMRLKLGTSRLYLDNEPFYIAPRSHIGFCWLRIVLHNERQKVLWVFADSTENRSYRQLARIVNTGLMRDC